MLVGSLGHIRNCLGCARGVRQTCSLRRLVLHSWELIPIHGSLNLQLTWVDFAVPAVGRDRLHGDLAYHEATAVHHDGSEVAKFTRHPVVDSSGIQAVDARRDQGLWNSLEADVGHQPIPLSSLLGVDINWGPCAVLEVPDAQVRVPTASTVSRSAVLARHVTGGLLVVASDADAVHLNGAALAQIGVGAWPSLLHTTCVADEGVLQLLDLHGAHLLDIAHHDPLDGLRAGRHRGAAIVVVRSSCQRPSKAGGQVQEARRRPRGAHIRIVADLAHGFPGACEAHVTED
mmetsp:Transcript_44471/g.72058  ORF Transcript_44471/g.72058 Transcript_44471/m.72058 type:complete len:288 (+) Transcript_44471:107-970(+)